MTRLTVGGSHGPIAKGLYEDLNRVDEELVLLRNNANKVVETYQEKIRQNPDYFISLTPGGQANKLRSYYSLPEDLAPGVDNLRSQSLDDKYNLQQGLLGIFERN
jgi:hypothetical protein